MSKITVHVHTHAYTLHMCIHTHFKEYVQIYKQKSTNPLTIIIIKLYGYYSITYKLYSLHILFKDTNKIINQKKRLEDENVKLRKRAATMREKIGSLASQLHKAKHSGFHTRRGPSRTKSPLEYTKCHQRRLKQQRRESCGDSLAWLHYHTYW